MNEKIKSIIKNILFPFNLLVFFAIVLFTFIFNPVIQIIVKIILFIWNKIYLVKNGYGFKIDRKRGVHYIEIKERKVYKTIVGLLVKTNKKNKIFLINENNWEEKVEEWAKSRRLEIKIKILEDPLYKKSVVE